MGEYKQPFKITNELEKNYVQIFDENISEEKIYVTVPTRRLDISIKEDLVEEPAAEEVKEEVVETPVAETAENKAE